ncbi:MAG: pseudouridine synthase [Burkholderiaceae bacterium]
MQDIGLLYADCALLVLNKAAGLLSVPGRGPDKQDCLSARVQALYPDALVVHRLDMATSGLMVMARGALAQKALNRAFANRQVSKRYVAVIDGLLAVPDPAPGLIDLPIIVDWPRRPLRIIDQERGQASLTRYWVIAQDLVNNSTRIELEPVTGRSHQLRIHLQALSHPILGDALYASTSSAARANRLLLHASELRLAHPVTGEWLSFSSPPAF